MNDQIINTPWGYFNINDALTAVTPTLHDVGDLVLLKSGGAPLTVLDYCPECDEVDLAWSDGVDVYEATYPGAALVSYEDCP